jgi:hypothetical protein
MASRQNKDTLKRREAKKHRKSVSRKVQTRAANHRERSARSSVAFEDYRPALPKLSAVILDYAKPLTDGLDNTTGQRNAIALAVMSWNASLLPLDKARETVGPMLAKLANGDGELEKELLGLFAMMYSRKKSHYASDRRFIVDYSLIDQGDSMHLEVMSTLMAA